MIFDFDDLDGVEEVGVSPYDVEAYTKAGGRLPQAPSEAGHAAEQVAAPADGEAAKAAATDTAPADSKETAGKAQDAASKAGSQGDGAAAAASSSPTMFDFDDLETTDPSRVPAKASDVKPAPKPAVYWKVVNTIDAGGIAVRSDLKQQNNGGRLQLHSVVLEKDRSGSDLRYEAVGGHSWGPKSGWVKIETRGTVWMTCLGTDFKPDPIPTPTTKGRQLKALIMFDWDDTLCPTSWIEQCPQLRNAFEGEVPRTGKVWEQLAEQAEAVKQLMEKALSIATVVLVTLAERPWVATSVRDFLPDAQPVTGLDIFYAREGSVPRAPTGACPLTAMKRRAMKSAVDTMVARLGVGTTWESLISIGDSDVEKRAAQDLGRECQNKGLVKYTKTVKLMDHPRVEQLTSQCRALNEKLREFVIFPGHRHISSADLLRPPN